MGIVEVAQNKLRQQEIEVRALVALMKHGKEVLNTKDGYRIYPQKEAEEALYDIAFPNKLAEKINKTLGEYE